MECGGRKKRLFGLILVAANSQHQQASKQHRSSLEAMPDRRVRARQDRHGRGMGNGQIGRMGSKVDRQGGIKDGGLFGLIRWDWQFTRQLCGHDQSVRRAPLRVEGGCVEGPRTLAVPVLC
jgi:hypothetical protein